MANQEHNPSVEFPEKKGRILFIDDEEMVCEVYRDMLLRLGHEVKIITSSIEALEAFKERPDHYNLVITDQTMPYLTGLDLAEKLRKVQPDISIILLTGYSELVSAKTASSYGINKILMKPCRLQQLNHVVNSTLD